MTFRTILPCLNQLGGSWEQNGTPSPQHSKLHHPGGQQQCEVHTQPVQPLPEVKQLTDQQKQELKRAILGSFKKDSAAASKLVVKSLDHDAKQQLLAALEASQEPPGISRTGMVDSPENHATPAAAAAAAPARDSSTAQEVQEPTFKQLLHVGITKGLPFVAFGFFDNIIMITAGEQIDLMFGAKLGLSSMAAAGLGNTVADVVGINISHTIEQKFKSMKSTAPALTKAQLALPRTQRAKWLGCAIGMASGCLLGLTPLLFHDAGHSEASHSSSSSAKQQPAAAT